MPRKRGTGTVYRGYAVGRKVTVQREKLPYEQPLLAEASQKLWNHSPDGFEWGYGGSGPAQLALAVLLDYYGDPKFAVQWHQSFKWNVIAKLPQQEDWRFGGETIEHAIAIASGAR